MMTPAAAQLILKTLAEKEHERGRTLYFNPEGGWAYCPVCGVSDKDYAFEFAATDGRDPVTQKDGLVLVFYIAHGKDLARRCAFGMAGTPANGPLAEQLLELGQALQVQALEERMTGRKSS
jgi:hypothetical protein